MGSDNFFSKVASIDPLAQALHLPGSQKYAQAVAQRNAGATDVNGGAYTGIAPTLAAANAGYTPGGPGAPVGWQQANLGSTPGWMNSFRNINSGIIPSPIANGLGSIGSTPVSPGAQQNAGNPSTAYVNAARGAQQENQRGY
jgi:hypothetical protein